MGGWGPHGKEIDDTNVSCLRLTRPFGGQPPARRHRADRRFEPLAATAQPGKLRDFMAEAM